MPIAIFLSEIYVAKGADIYNQNPHINSWTVVSSQAQDHHIAALIAPLAASRFISAALPLPRKYMYTCCTYETQIWATSIFNIISPEKKTIVLEMDLNDPETKHQFNAE